MSNLIRKPSYQIKLERLKNEGLILKCLLGDVIQKGWAYIFNGQDGTFDEAFGRARSEGLKYFRWNGSLYNTKLDLPKEDIQQPLDFSGILTTNGRPYNPEDIAYINDRLSQIAPPQRASILANIIEESGGDPLIVGPGHFYGLLQWDNSRYSPRSRNRLQEMDALILYILDTMDNTTDQMSWHHGGTGSGYRTAQAAHDAFKDTNIPVDSVNWAYTLGYVRPKGTINSARNRSRVANQIYQIIK